ncbi:MAG: universal stress protein [Thermodesulfobacteriota bacterium]
MYKNIIMPTDGLDSCVYGTCHGVVLAKTLGAKVTAVCVTKHLTLQEIMRAYHPEMDWRMSYSRKAPEIVEHAHQKHKELTDKALAVAEKMCSENGVPCTKVYFEDEDAAEGLLRVAEKEGCDLVFLSRHGHTGIMGKLFGDVAGRIVSKSRIPVLTHYCGGPS